MRPWRGCGEHVGFGALFFLLGVDMASVRDTALHLHSRKMPTLASAGERQVVIVRLTPKLLSPALFAAAEPFPKLRQELS